MAIFDIVINFVGSIRLQCFVTNEHEAHYCAIKSWWLSSRATTKEDLRCLKL